MKQYPITCQTVYRGREEYDNLVKLLDEMKELGMYGIELNLPDLDGTIPAEELKALLDERGLKMTYVASGVYAGTHGLALCAQDEEIRAAAVRGLLANIAYAKKMGAGVIIGTLKGSSRFFWEKSREQLVKSLAEAMPLADPAVPVLLEATNHYEADTANTLSEAISIVKEVGAPNLYILPDTYHMNIEERDWRGALRDAYQAGLVRNLHVSDNNRYFPGFGAIDFSDVYALLDEIDYPGTLGIEGRNLGSLVEDLRASMEYLKGKMAE